MLLNIDPLALAIGYLRQQSELSGLKIAADLIGHTNGDKAIVIEVRPDSRRVVRDKMDRWGLALNYYGPDKRSVAQLAGVVREILLERLPATRIDGVVVSYVQ